MSKLFEQKPVWTSCSCCDKYTFTTSRDFMMHLKEKHCSKNGDMYVCQYGENNVCKSAYDSGMCWSDYEEHVFQEHWAPASTCTSQTLYNLPAQNLPAVLNDPNKGKKKDLFTKTWGENFVEVTDISHPNYLPTITRHHFEHYLKKIGKKHKQHLKLNLAHPKEADFLDTFPHIKNVRSAEKDRFDISLVPKIFLQPSFDLSNIETFKKVFKEAVPTNLPVERILEPTARSSTKLLQEKLTHYLDLVEVQIAQQVTQKSDAFFVAMTSHDVLMEQLGHTIAVVKKFRGCIKEIDDGMVREPLYILYYEHLKTNYQLVLRKIRVMSTVMQTQPMVQVLLSSPDYVGALDLIQTTQDLLKEELAGIHCFRHLSSELSEMLVVIDTLMKEEFEKHSMADLNRPLLDSEPQVLEGEKLICIIIGLLRRGITSFVEIYEEECVSAVKAAIKQAVIEVIAGSDKALSDSRLEDQLMLLNVDEWSTLLINTTNVLLKLLHRIKKGYDLMVRAVNISAGKNLVQKENEDIFISDTGDWELSEDEEEKVLEKLKQFLIYVSRYSQERCVQLLSSRSLVWSDEKKEDSKELNGTYWFGERATLSQLKMLAAHVSKISREWDEICPEASLTSLRSAFNIQASKFMNKFHSDKMRKLFLLLESEPWRQTDVPAAFQQLVYHISEKGTFAISSSPYILNEKNHTQSVLLIGDEKFAVVGTVLMLVNIVAEYCNHAEEIPGCADHLHRYLSELLTQFNSRCYSLVLGGDAVSENTGLKTITINNLALALRSLQLILWLIPHLRVHFQGIIGELSRDYLDKVSQKVKEHASDVNAKLVEVVHKNIAAELKSWDAKPPVPSKSFQNICKHLKKCYEAVSCVLPANQLEDLYRKVNASFIIAFSEKLQKMNILNNGGPTHGLVTQELLFYLEDMKQVKVLPAEILDISVVNEEIWTHTTGR